MCSVRPSSRFGNTLQKNLYDHRSIFFFNVYRIGFRLLAEEFPGRALHLKRPPVLLRSVVLARVLSTRGWSVPPSIISLSEAISCSQFARLFFLLSFYLWSSS